MFEYDEESQARMVKIIKRLKDYSTLSEAAKPGLLHQLEFDLEWLLELCLKLELEKKKAMAEDDVFDPFMGTDE